MEQKIMTHHPFERCAPTLFGRNFFIEQRGALEIAASVRRLGVRLYIAFLEGQAFSDFFTDKGSSFLDQFMGAGARPPFLIHTPVG
jgi:hypothetical protein